MGRLLFWSLTLLVLVSVWATPAFFIVESNGVVVPWEKARNPHSLLWGGLASGVWGRGPSLWLVSCGCFTSVKIPRNLLRDSSLEEAKTVKAVHFAEYQCDQQTYIAGSIYSSSHLDGPFVGCPSSFEQQVIDLVNYERTLVGLSPLELDVRLQIAAQWMSNDMTSENYVPTDHIDSLDRTFAIRVAEEGAYPYVHLGEVIAGGFSSPKDVVIAWMNSPGHNARLLDEEYEHIGVGYTYDPSTDHWFYWVADLGSTTEPRQSSSLDCDPKFYLLFLSHIQK